MGLFGKRKDGSVKALGNCEPDSFHNLWHLHKHDGWTFEKEKTSRIDGGTLNSFALQFLKRGRIFSNKFVGIDKWPPQKKSPQLVYEMTLFEAYNKYRGLGRGGRQKIRGGGVWWISTYRGGVIHNEDLV